MYMHYLQWNLHSMHCITSFLIFHHKLFSCCVFTSALGLYSYIIVIELYIFMGLVGMKKLGLHVNFVSFDDY